MHRFRNARRWAALTLVPAAAATMITASLAVAQTDVLPDSEAPAGAEPTVKERRMSSKVVLRVKRHVLTGKIGVAAGQVWPHTGNRRVTLRLDGEKVRTVRTGRGGRFRIRLRRPARSDRGLDDRPLSMAHHGYHSRSLSVGRGYPTVTPHTKQSGKIRTASRRRKTAPWDWCPC